MVNPKPMPVGLMLCVDFILENILNNLSKLFLLIPTPVSITEILKAWGA